MATSAERTPSRSGGMISLHRRLSDVGVHSRLVSDWQRHDSAPLYSWGSSLWFTKNRAHRTITLDQAIDEIGFHGSAAADNTSSDIS
jgi:hypothetical protein